MGWDIIGFEAPRRASGTEKVEVTGDEQRLSHALWGAELGRHHPVDAIMRKPLLAISSAWRAGNGFSSLPKSSSHL